MVILGGLEIVAAGYLLKEYNKDKEEEERERERDRERRRRRRHHSRDDNSHGHHSRYDDPLPGRQSRPPQQNQHLQPLHPGGPPRPYSAPPPQSRPPMMPGGWQQQPPQFQPQRPPANPGTWPMQQNQQRQQWQGQQQQQHRPVPPNNNPHNPNFIPPPLQRPGTSAFPPPNMHLDTKTGKWQTSMYPTEMAAQNKRDGVQELRREKSMPPLPSSQHHQSHAYGNGNSQPQINISPPPNQGRPMAHSFSASAPALPEGYAELDAETPGRFRRHQNEKAVYEPQQGGGRAHSSSFTQRYADENEIKDPPPAYRE